MMNAGCLYVCDLCGCVLYFRLVWLGVYDMSVVSMETHALEG